MKLVDLKIANFRGIRSLEMPLDQLTVLIGENNTGKSSVVEAIRLVLSRGFGTRRDARFTEYDFHLKDAAATPQTVDPIAITLHFAEKEQNDWPDAIVQQLNDVIQVDSSGLSHIWFQAKGSYSTDSGSFETKWAFLNEAQAELAPRNSTPLNLLSRFVPLFFLSALRDASQEFGQRGQFWSGFLKSIELPEDKRAEIENTLHEVNAELIAANGTLAEVTRRLGVAGKLVPLAAVDPVVLEAIPTRVFDMVGKIQVHLKSAIGAKLPLQRHGEGTQNLAVLMLFQAFAAAALTEAYEPESTPILALEEPEAHLHPCAVRSLGAYLNELLGQVIATSHSGDLVSRVPVMALRRLCKRNGDTHVGRVEPGSFTPRELQAIDYSIRLAKGHYLFSRCWLLVEGESDYHLMPLLFRVMGHSQDGVNFSLLEISQVIDKGEPFMKFAKSLGIEWFLMADGDMAGADYVRRAASHLAAGETLADRAQALTQLDIEHEFWHSGYEDFIKSLVPQTRKTQIALDAGGDATEQTKLLIKAAIKAAGGKPAFAQELANEVQARGANTIPQVIRDIITRVVQLSGG